jgi:hypothetical protein
MEPAEQWHKPFLLLLLLCLWPCISAGQSSCLDCHEDKQHGQKDFHRIACTTCHAGDASSRSESEAHSDLIAFPGNLSNVDQTCGQCHAEQTQGVHQHIMTTARGMVATTRHVLGDPDDGASINELGTGLSDSLLRKLCAGCHLGRDRTQHSHSTLNRGGGCLACHLDEYPESGHIRLTKKVSDARCFGCHSRSARISLNYAGLAEIDADGPGDANKKARLPDGRLVLIRESDVHHQAGMACIDCHSGNQLMGTGSPHAQTGIECMDCHQARNEAPLPTLPTNIQESEDTRILVSRVTGNRMEIPTFQAASHPLNQEHARLGCDACHTQWAPLCYGCHVEFDPSGQQYDYLQQSVTEGRWREKRWLTQSGPPPLGVDANNKIRPFVPGMIMTLDHPDLDEPLFRRLFSPLAPHTTGKARSCQSCHCEPTALGLGTGKLLKSDKGWSFTADGARRMDGITEDAWQQWGQLGIGASTQDGARPLNAIEIRRLLEVDIACTP